jgi:hypothetical protein
LAWSQKRKVNTSGLPLSFFASFLLLFSSTGYLPGDAQSKRAKGEKIMHLHCCVRIEEGGRRVESSAATMGLFEVSVPSRED